MRSDGWIKVGLKMNWRTEIVLFAASCKSVILYVDLEKLSELNRKKR